MLPTGCGSSHTSVTSAVEATMSMSSTFTLRSPFGSGVAGDTSTGGSSDLCLVGLAGVVSHGLGGVEDAAAAEDDGAASLGQASMSPFTSLRGCFCSSFIVWFWTWSLLHIWFVRRARGIQYLFRSRLRIRGSRWRFSVGIGHRWQWYVPNGVHSSLQQRHFVACF